MSLESHWCHSDFVALPHLFNFFLRNCCYYDIISCLCQWLISFQQAEIPTLLAFARSPEPPKFSLMFLFSIFLLDPLPTTAPVSVGAESEPEPHAVSLLSSAVLTRCDKPGSQTAALSCVHIKQRESSLGSIDNHRQAKACQAVKAR